MKKKIFAPSPRSHRLRPPDLYEFSIDNYWFKAVGIESQKITGPLRGSHTADIVIVGGGYTGLSSAYNIQQKFFGTNGVIHDLPGISGKSILHQIVVGII